MKKVRVFEPTITQRGEFQKGPQEVSAELAEWLVRHNLAEYVESGEKEAKHRPGEGSAERRETAVKRK